MRSPREEVYREKRRGLRTEPCSSLTFGKSQREGRSHKGSKHLGRFEDNQKHGCLQSQMKKAFQEIELISVGSAYPWCKSQGEPQEPSPQGRERGREQANYCRRGSRVWAEPVRWSDTVECNLLERIKEFCLYPS